MGRPAISAAVACVSSAEALALSRVCPQSGIGTDHPNQRGNDDCEPHAGVHPAMKLTLPGLKELFLPSRATRSSADIAAIGARALFQAPDNAMTPRRSLVQFLAQVSL